MPLMLVQKRLSGEPVGIFLEDGKKFYRAQDDALQIAGESRVSERNPGMSWNEFVENRTNSTPHRYWWDSVTSTQPMAQTLDNEYDKWSARESGANVLDH